MGTAWTERLGRVGVRVYEDSGGGLHMSDGITYVSGFEHQAEPGGLLSDIVSYEEWRNNASTTGPAKEIEDTIEHETTDKIATWDGEHIWINVHRMGCAGLRYLGIANPV